jgi:hypothetical protein
MLFLNIQVLHSFITIQDHIVMRHVCIVLTTILLLLLSLIIVLGDEAFATTEIPNMTLTEPPSGFTPVQNVSTPISLEQLAMSAPPSNISQQLQQQRQLSLQHPLSSLQPPLVSLIPNEQTLQVPGTLQQSSENMSSSLSSTSLPPFSEYNNSKYGFKIQYPSDWKVNSTANDSLSSPPITGASTDVVASITSPSDLQRERQGLVTISVENLSEAASQQANGNLTAYDYAAPIIKQLSLTLGSATEGGQTNLVRNESLNIGSETSGKNSKNLSAWRIDTIASDYKSDVFVINGTRVFDIGFSAPKESATQSLPIFDKMLNSFQFTVTTPNVTANEDTLSTTDMTNASVTNNQSIIPLSETVQQKPLSQLSSSLIPLPSQQQQPSTFQTEQQQPLPPPSNISQQLQLHLDEAIKAPQAGDTAGAKVHMTEADKVIQEGAAKMHLDEAIKALVSGDTAGAETHAQMAQDSQQQQQQPLPPPSNISQQVQQLQQQQPLLGQVMQQQQPIYQQPPLAQQQQMSPIYQQPTAQIPSTIPQQLPTQPLFQTSPQTQSLLQSNPAQPYGIPSTTATIQPQLSALPPTATTFPPSVLPPVNSLQPYGTTGGLGYPSTIGGQYGLGAAGSAAGAAPTSVSTSSQLVSPWFPSLPATYCGGTFQHTIEGTPRGNGDNDNKIEAADSNDNNRDDDDDDGDNHKNSKDSDREKRLLSLQVNSDNSRIFTDDDAISGEIFLGKNNIDKNKGNDFDIKSIFNDCQVITYSKG